MLLAIDLGNTRAKAAVFEGKRILAQVSVELLRAAPEIDAFSEKFPGITNAVCTSVGTQQLPMLKNVIVQQVSRDWKFPFVNLYGTPETLGIDRMVLASGAALAHPGCNTLVIDAGTCITYDFIDDCANYHGGAISPGLSMRYRALHDFTAKLPLVTPDAPGSFTGKSTREAINSGVVNGLVAELEAFMDHYRAAGNFIIILTGGDSEFLAGRLKNRIFANPNFLLESLNRLFQYQITNDQ